MFAVHDTLLCCLQRRPANAHAPSAAASPVLRSTRMGGTVAGQRQAISALPDPFTVPGGNMRPVRSRNATSNIAGPPGERPSINHSPRRCRLGTAAAQARAGTSHQRAVRLVAGARQHPVSAGGRCLTRGAAPSRPRHARSVPRCSPRRATQPAPPGGSPPAHHWRNPSWSGNRIRTSNDPPAQPEPVWLMRNSP